MAGTAHDVTRTIRYPGLVLLSLVWTVIGSLAYARHYLQDHNAAAPEKMLFEFLIWLTCFYPWIALAPLVFRLERRYPLGTHRWWRNLGGLMAAALPLAYVGAAVTQLLYAIVHILFRKPLHVPSPWRLPPLPEVGVQLVLYWTTVGGAYVVRSLIQLRDREQQAAKFALEKAQLESTLRRAELDTLRARLNPHFLFNCLQNISVLTREDPQTASQMLAHLGTLLRTALRRDRTSETTLASEIDLTKHYVAVEKVRFADRLTVLFDIAVESELALVPNFLLQPLVENAIVHGLQGLQRNGVISIRSAIEACNLVVTVVDNGIGLPARNATGVELGIGLSSTCERLEKMYPQQHSFSIRSLPEGGTEVRVSLPLRFAMPPAGVTCDEQTALIGR